ncbi:methyltransferase domain-containing protein [Rothia santali]|uniref:methyltransferase domain-containing protein n=1 Tax=Rothia santali TaxID=2949643 RepID=UPI0028168325|nr:methyltransferase domain-containing protein [Rothia santali]
MGPGPLPALRRRAEPPLRGPPRPGASRARGRGPARPLVVDLGCGPGTDTPILRPFFPGARLEAVDASPEMVDAARAAAPGDDVEYVLADVRAWLAARRDAPGEAPRAIVSNAMFQWVEDHLGMIPELADLVAPGGSLALQVPANFDAPSHVLLRELAARPEYARHVTARLRDTSVRAEEYLRALARPGWRVDAWETTYLHVLQGPDPVFEWISGTGARPVLESLPDAERERFAREYRAALRRAYPALRRAYPAGEAGTVLPFRRVFAVATRD